MLKFLFGITNLVRFIGGIGFIIYKIFTFTDTLYNFISGIIKTDK